MQINRSFIPSLRIQPNRAEMSPVGGGGDQLDEKILSDTFYVSLNLYSKPARVQSLAINEQHNMTSFDKFLNQVSDSELKMKEPNLSTSLRF